VTAPLMRINTGSAGTDKMSRTDSEGDSNGRTGVAS
jgi:hypothetical protein